MIDKRIESGGGVNVDFGDPPIEKMLQGATRLILRVEIEQRNRNLISLKPFGQGNHHACFTDSAFTAHREDHTLRISRHCSPPLVVRVSGSFSRKTKRARFDSRTADFALSAATRSSAGDSAPRPTGGSSN